MNDALRSDFDANRIRADPDTVVGTLAAAGTIVIMVRYHDHGAGVVVVGALAGTYRPGTWSVDRLHSSEWGHRMLARRWPTVSRRPVPWCRARCRSAVVAAQPSGAR
ncbi:MAG TPA: hypothetical protein VFX16_13010 [Pseudonocardiaceae bacterium]|nr:hypothetical protein [Pseudonocardiaceae bacterium]